MDYKYIEQLLERYWDAETSLEEESILRAFFRQETIPGELMQWKPYFAAMEKKEASLGDDFDARILGMTGNDTTTVKAREVKLTRRLMPLFKAAAIVAIFLTLGGALQAPWDNTWNTPEDYAALQQADTVVAVEPVQAENITDMTLDSTRVMTPVQPQD